MSRKQLVGALLEEPRQHRRATAGSLVITASQLALIRLHGRSTQDARVIAISLEEPREAAVRQVRRVFARYALFDRLGNMSIDHHDAVLTATNVELFGTKLTMVFLNFIVADLLPIFSSK